MSNIMNSYPVFEDNQVLTSTQLNDLVKYLDEQNRLTRIKLIGVGVMCGLKPSYNSTTHLFSVSSGAGVTTEGYLLQIPDTTYDRYRVYTLPDGVDYPPFIDPNSATQFPMFEALPVSYVPQVGETIGTIDNTFMTDMIAVLFFECVDVDLQSCLGKSCDENGIDRIFNTRMLLVNKLVIDEMVADNHLATDLNYPAKFDLADYAIRRALFDPTQLHSTSYFEFSKLYSTMLKSAYNGDPGDPVNRPGIVESIRRLYTIFQPVLETVYPAGDPLTTAVIPTGGKTAWNDIIGGNNTSGPAYLGIQYMYDFVKDLILAYDEFRNKAFDLMSQCCVSSALFPKHLFLGEGIPVDDCRPSMYRHEWVAAPVNNDQRQAREELLMLHQRMVLMLKHFDTAIIHNPLKTALPDIKITPSFEKRSYLSDRAVPYYYDADAVDSVLNKSLESVWKYDNIRKCKGDGSGQFPVMSWRNQTGDPFTPTTTVKTPLFFDYDFNPFLRIEGHLRWNVDDAMAEINQWKHFFDLPINVIKLRLAGQSTDAEILARCNFNDLRSQYTGARNEMECFLRKIFDHFFTYSASTGEYSVKPLPSFMTHMGSDAAVAGGSSSVEFLPSSVSSASSSSSLSVGDSVANPSRSETSSTSADRSVAVVVYDPRDPQQISNAISAALGQMLINMQNALAHLPTELSEFEFGNDINTTSQSFIKSYLAAVNNAITVKTNVNYGIDQILKSTRNRFPVEAYVPMVLWASEYFWFINEFVSSCLFRELEAIFYTREYRVGYLKGKDMTVFSNFIEKNPGVNHEAGAGRGQTFVLVYPGAPLTTVPRSVNVATSLQLTINAHEVELAGLVNLPVQTPTDQRRINQLRADLCVMYKDQFDTIKDNGALVKPLPVTAVVSPKPAYKINLGPNDVIADFTLPYLTTCECDCNDIPAPDAADLAIPALNIPALYEYGLGDYAFVNDKDTTTTGCYNSGEAMPSLPISVTPFQSVSGTLVLKIVTNASGSLGTSFITANGGQVSVSNADGKNFATQQFIYSPKRTFLGMDWFDYVFEIYDSAGNIKLRSNRARVRISVVPRCNAVVTVNTAEGIPNIPIG